MRLLRGGWAWLAVGAGLSLLAVHGRWDVPVAAWLAPIFLLRFTRTRSPLAGVAAVWAATSAGVACWLYESGIEVLSPMLLLCLGVNTVVALPYLVDRLVAPRFAATGALLASLAFPLARVVAESAVARFGPIGDIFGSMAATQHGNLPLLQVVSVTGSVGVSFLIAWFAAVVNGVWQRQAPLPRIRTVAFVYAGVLVAVLAGGAVRLAVPPSEPTVRVAGVSPSRELLERRESMLDNFKSFADVSKADPALVRPAFSAVNEDLLASTEREAWAGAKIITWPEAGAGVLVEDKAELIAKAASLARTYGSYLVLALGVVTDEAPYGKNQAVLIDTRGEVIWTYDKARPVPGMEPFVPGDGRVPTVDTPYGRLANLICFDADFPALARQGGSQGVDLMFVPSNDWREVGVMHAEKATMRAVENGYSLVRQDSNGVARVIDHQGRVLASSDYFSTDQQTMVAAVPTKGVRTIYGTIGDVFGLLCGAALLVLAVASRRSARRLAADLEGLQ